MAAFALPASFALVLTRMSSSPSLLRSTRSNSVCAACASRIAVACFSSAAIFAFSVAARFFVSLSSRLRSSTMRLHSRWIATSFSRAVVARISASSASFRAMAPFHSW